LASYSYPTFTTHTHARTHISYISPEGAYGTVLDWHAADQWSLGVILYIILTARPLYSHPNDRAFEILACGGAPMLVHHYATVYGLALPEGAVELVTALLRPDPIDRPTIEEVLMHPWVRPALEGLRGHWWTQPQQPQLQLQPLRSTKGRGVISETEMEEQ
jgi:serine/threonine protein kinase